MNRILLFLLPLFLFGCSIFGPDPAVTQAQQDAKAAQDELARVKALHEKGEATDAELAAAIGRADKALVDLETALKVSGAKSGEDFGTAGGAIGGALGGPLGAAIGTLGGGLIGGFVAWMKTRSRNAALASVQAGRALLHEKHPEAAAAFDAKVKEVMPPWASALIKALKSKGVIAELPG